MNIGDYLLIGGSWIIYLSLHSVLASNQIKGQVSVMSASVFRHYRILYSIVSSLGLVLILYWMAITPSKTLFDVTETLRYVALVFASWGVILIVVAFRHISGFEFIGLSAQSSPRLIRNGLHGRIRHPIYAGIILIMIGLFLYLPTDLILLTAVLVLIYLPIGIYLEEKKLIQEFGQEYIDYRQKVPAVIPGIR